MYQSLQQGVHSHRFHPDCEDHLWKHPLCHVQSNPDQLLRLQPVPSERLSVCPMLLLQLYSLRQLYRFFPERRSCRSVLQLCLLLPGHHRMLLLYLQHLRLLLYLLFPLLLPLQCLLLQLL